MVFELVDNIKISSVSNRLLVRQLCASILRASAMLKHVIHCVREKSKPVDNVR